AGEDAVAARGVLTAYLSVRDSGVDGRAFKDFLAGILPEHMIPARFVVLDQLPRTPAGKLDRRSVVFAGGSELGTGTSDVVAPRNEVEEALVQIWQDVLGVDEVSVHDDFFEIGGDSLLSIRVISRAGREGIRITPQNFFEAPTIAELATRAGGPEVAAEQGVVVGTAPLTPIQHWFFERITRHPHHWNQAVLLRPPKGAGPEEIRNALRTLLTHHDALRTRFVWVDGERRQEFPPLTDDLPFRAVDLTGTPAGEREGVMESQADQEHVSLDLEEGGLFRAVYFDGGPDFRRLLLVAHHLVIDAESWGLVLEDLSGLVAGGREDASRSLPRKTTSALAWAEALTEAAGSPDVAGMAEHWTHAPATGAEAAPGVADPSSAVA
ncbi:MAG TPA: condensation domain-containing protein, partial [Longimicrobiales bacterium]|nr:condensation domain-containing protein [Longimicrobiales bacterium]